MQQAVELGQKTSLLPKTTNKITRAIEQRDEVKDEYARLHKVVEELKFETANTPEH